MYQTLTIQSVHGLQETIVVNANRTATPQVTTTKPPSQDQADQQRPDHQKNRK